MYIICSYDVNSKHCTKFMKTLRKYLFHVQESVFEGELTPKQYKKLNNELSKLISDDDHVLFYYSYNNKDIIKKELGKSEDKTNIIID